MASKSMGEGLEPLLTWYDTNINETEPIYSIWQGNNLLFSYCENDAEQSRQSLEDNINGLIQNGYNEILTARLHRIPENLRNKFEYVTKSTPTYSTFFFRPCPYKKAEYLPYNGTDLSEMNLSPQSYLIMNKLGAIESRLNAQDEAADYDDDDDDNQEQQQQQPEKITIAGVINTALQQPAIQTAIIGMLTNVLNKFMNVGTPQPAQQYQQFIAGIPGQLTDQEKEILFDAINKIKTVRPQIIEDIYSLGNIAINEPGKASMILSMLPK